MVSNPPKKNEATCALCLLVKPLARSHIIPDFLLKEIEDWIERGRSGQKQPHLNMVDYATAKEISCRQKGNALKEEGLVQHLLCQDCEKRIKVGEDYARLCLYGWGSEKTHTRPSKSVRRYRIRRGRFLCEGHDVRWVDYDKFKAFQIGIIWRMSVAKGKSFQGANTSEQLKERMRLALLSGDFEEDLAPCAMEFLEDRTGSNLGFFGFPKANENIVSLAMGGYLWHYFLEGPAPIEITLQKSGYFLVKVSDINCFYTPDSMLNH